MRKWDDREVSEATRLPPYGPALLLLLGLILLGLGIFGLGFFKAPRQGEVPLLVEGVIVDAETGLPVEADVYLDGRLLYERVRSFSVRVPQGSELRVEAEGYHPWAFRFRYELHSPYRFHGPIRLQKKTSGIQSPRSKPGEE